MTTLPATVLCVLLAQPLPGGPTPPGPPDVALIMPRSLAFSPDGSTLAVGLSTQLGPKTTGALRFVDAATLRSRTMYPLNFEVTELTYARDGKSLFLRGQFILWQGNLPPTALPEAGWIDATNGAFHASSAAEWFGKNPPKSSAGAAERAATACADSENRIHVIDPTTKRELVCLSGHKQRVITLRWNADGRRLISASEGEFGKPLEVVIWDIPGQRVLKSLPGIRGPLERVLLSEDGRYLAVGVRAVDASTDLTVWDVQGGVKTCSFTRLAYGMPIAFSPDSRRLAVVEYSGKLRVVELRHGK